MKKHTSESEPLEEEEGPLEIPVVGDLSENESDLCDKLLGVPPGGECLLYFNSPGGSAYAATSIMSLILLRGIRATGVVTGECSSAALWPFAACSRRLVTPFSVLLFHPMKWQSEEHVALAEATEWARHFRDLESSMDRLLGRLLGISSEQLERWTHPGCYTSGAMLVEAGLAEMIDLATLDSLRELAQQADDGEQDPRDPVG